MEKKKLSDENDLYLVLFLRQLTYDCYDYDHAYDHDHDYDYAYDYAYDEYYDYADDYYCCSS